MSPVVVEHYLAGRTLHDVRSSNGSAKRYLTVSEDALLELLETPVSS